MKERVKTERLILRVLNESDKYELLDFYERNRNFFKPWAPRFDKSFYTVGYQLNKINFERELWNKGTEIRYYIFKKEQPERIAGIVTAFNIVRSVFQCGTLGYDVDENENGKGIATEAIKKLIEILFNELNLHRLEANVIPSNAASIRVLEKLNFVKEGYSKNYLKINDKWQDHLRFALLNEKYSE